MQYLRESGWIPTFFFAAARPILIGAGEGRIRRVFLADELGLYTLLMLPFEIENRRDEIKREIEKLGAELVEINFRKTSGRNVLLIIAAKPSGITLDDCARINRALSQTFDALPDEGGFFSTPYYLEVNSPGLDRPLRTEADFRRVLGQEVRVAFRNDRGAGLVSVGEVLGLENGVLTLQLVGEKGKISLPLASITKASRAIRIGK